MHMPTQFQTQTMPDGTQAQIPYMNMPQFPFSNQTPLCLPTGMDPQMVYNPYLMQMQQMQMQGMAQMQGIAGMQSSMVHLPPGMSLQSIVPNSTSRQQQKQQQQKQQQRQHQQRPSQQATNVSAPNVMKRKAPAPDPRPHVRDFKPNPKKKDRKACRMDDCDKPAATRTPYCTEHCGARVCEKEVRNIGAKRSRESIGGVKRPYLTQPSLKSSTLL